MIKKLVIVLAAVALTIFSAAAAYGGFSSLSFTGKNGGISIVSNASGTDEQFTIQSKENFSFSQTVETHSSPNTDREVSFSGGGNIYIFKENSIVGITLEGEECSSSVGDNCKSFTAYAEGDEYSIQQFVCNPTTAIAGVNVSGDGCASSENEINLLDGGMEITDFTAQGTGVLEFYGEANSSLDVDIFIKIGEYMSVSVGANMRGRISSTCDFEKNLEIKDAFLSAYEGSATIKVVNCYLDK